MLHPLDPARSSYGYRPAAADDPAVSIITPFYNTGPLFMDTVRTLLGQSLQQWEWLIVNDGSDDPVALRALLPLRSADLRIRVLDQPNRGPSAARNAGVAASRAPLLFFLDSDDLLAPTTLEKLVWTIYSHPDSAFATGWNIFFGYKNRAWPRGFDTRYAFLYESMTTVSAVVRRTVYEQAGGYDEARRAGLEDNEFWLRCAANGFWGHDVHEYLLWIRLKHLRDYTSYRWAFRESQQAYRAFRKEMRARYPQLFRDGLPGAGSEGGLLDVHTPIPTELPFQNRLLRPAGQRRILLLIPWLLLGGVERFTLDLVAALTARGDRVTVCLLRDVEHIWQDELQRASSDVFNLARFLRPADYPRFLHYLIQSRQISTVLISNALLGYQLLPYLRSRCPGVAFVDFLHNEEHWRAGGFPRASLEHQELLDRQLVSTAHLRRWLIDRGAEPERVAICTTNIDTRHWAPDPALRAGVRAELGIPNDLAVVLFVGRLVPQKRPLFVADILHKLDQSGTPFLALVAGNGEDRPALQRLLKRRRLDERVRVLGAVSHERVRELLAAADLLLLPSQLEGLALVLYEALAMGVVPVTANVGGQRELLTPDCGVLVPPGPGELEQYVAALADLIADPQKRAAMACAGRTRVVAHFGIDSMLDCIQAQLDQAGALAHRMPRPAVGPGAGLAAATLAIEHFQLETRLRGLPPVRAVLALRRSSSWRLLGRLRGLRRALDTTDRLSYTIRRELMQRARRLLGRREQQF